MTEASDLSDEEQNLLDLAHAVRRNAYAPYSNFKVGAALLAEDGKVYSGCNVENSSFGMTICAERSAVVQAVSLGERSFRAIAVVAGESGPIVTPCGACRQVLAEFNPQMPVLLQRADPTSPIIRTSVAALLPGDFHLSDHQ